MGAEISPTLNKNVTHVIFKEGTQATYNKAKSQDKCIVAASWVKACYESGQKVDEKNFPITDFDRYESPVMFGRTRVS